MVDRNGQDEQKQIRRERWKLLVLYVRAAEGPMVILSIVWLVLLILDFTTGLNRPLRIMEEVIWGLFGVDFAIGFLIAPHKRTYLRQNWLTALSLALPAVRMLRAFRALRFLRAARAARSLNLIRLLTTLNRGMRAARYSLGRRGLGYVVVLTMIVTLGGAAGMVLFESPTAVRQAGGAPGAGLPSYGEALWWTATTITTMGSEYWPKTTEGRLLGWLLSLYAFAVFGYITASLASFFIGQDTDAWRRYSEDRSQESKELREEVAALRAQVAALVERLDRSQAGSNHG